MGHSSDSLQTSRRAFLRSVGGSLVAWPLLDSDVRGEAPAVLDYSIFKESPERYRGTTMWGYDLSNVTGSKIVAGVDDLARQHYGGFLITNDGGNGSNLDPAYVAAAKPFFNFTDDGIEFMSEEFFRLYRLAIEEGLKKQLPLNVLYDDYEYPTGTVAGQLYMQYPQYMAKRLDMTERDVRGPAKIMLAIPKGIYIGAVMMNKNTFERVDVSSHRIREDWLSCSVPEGNWKVMVFYLNLDAVLKIRNPGLVDYLGKDAMNAFLSLTYDKFYAHLKDYFGKVIKMSFFDEPTLHWLDGRTWTPAFNEEFEKRFGHSPMPYYPALWYDIGSDTAAARNALYGFRAVLFAENFAGRIRNWCHEHGMLSTGHVDQEEATNPVPINGDLMKIFEHQDIPGHDDILYLGRANLGYKVVTSAAYNYDKPVVMCETYAAYEKMDEQMLFRVAMDQFAMGINFQIPAASISRRAPDVPAFNAYVGRLTYLLQHGRHVADIGVLYPIAALQACYHFACDPIPESVKKRTSVGGLGEILGPCWEYAYYGGIVPAEIDYQTIGEILFRELRVDYTYLHPEILVSRCLIQGKKLVLNNQENREEFTVLIVPGGDTLSYKAARKIQEFYHSGGTLVATSGLAHRSAEFGHDQEVQQVISQIFGISVKAVTSGNIQVDESSGYLVHRNDGGTAFFIPKPNPGRIEMVLKEVLPVRDVEFREEMWPIKEGLAYDGALTYLHKVKNNQDIYFFANSSGKAIDTDVILRGKKELHIWNPHTGEREQARAKHHTQGGVPTTRVRLTLPASSSLFYVQERV